jgi:MFS family permease
VAGLGVYRQLIANRPLTKLLAGEFVSCIGDWLYIVAIFVVIYRDTGDAALVGLFGAVRVIPYVVLSIPAGVVADRFDRRLVLLVSDIWRGSVMVLIALLLVVDAPVLPIAALAILATCGSAFFYPAMGAYVPNLVTDERQLGPANSAWSSLDNLSFILGPAIGGLLLALGAVTVAFVLNALTFVVVAVILWELPSSTNFVPVAIGANEAALAPTEAASGTAAGSPETDSVAPAAASAPPVSRPPSRATLALLPLVGIGILQALDGFFDTGLQTLTVILAIDVLQAGEEANGYLNAAIGVGGLLGAIASGVLVLRRNLRLPLIVGSMVFGVGLLVLGAIPLLVVALVAIAVANAGALILDVVMTTIFQRVVPDELRGRWIGIFMTVNTLVGAVGAIVLPILVVNVGAGPTLGVAALAVIVASLAGLALIGRGATREPSQFEATLAEVAKLPLFVGVPAARLEATLARLREVPVSADQAVVREGEPADRFFMIESGAFVVTQAAGPGALETVLRRLGPNQVFGELGLLQGSSRTATVTAETDGVLLELDGADFLELVGAGGPLRSRLLGLYTAPGSPG